MPAGSFAKGRMLSYILLREEGDGTSTGSKSCLVKLSRHGEPKRNPYWARRDT